MITEICMTDDHLWALNNGQPLVYVAEDHNVMKGDLIAVHDRNGNPARTAVVVWAVPVDGTTHFGIEAWDKGEIGKAH